MQLMSKSFLCRNHETLNVAGRFRYATMAGMQDFAAWSTAQAVGAALKVRCLPLRGTYGLLLA